MNAEVEFLSGTGVVFRAIEGSRQRACPGDGGGPALIRVGIQLFVAGIISYTDFSNRAPQPH